MTEDHKSPTSGVNAWLLLPPPPEQDSVSWYWALIAGAPFLLRNVLNIQRGGAEKLLICSRLPLETAGELKQRLNRDKRVSIPVEFASTPRGLEEDSGKILVLDGSALYHQSEVRDALARARKLAELSPAFPQIEQYVGGNPVEGGGIPFSCPGQSEARVSSRDDFRKQHLRLMQTGGLHNDSFITRILSRSVSNLLTRAAIGTSLTPNRITVCSFLLGLAAVGFLAAGGYYYGIAGAVLLVFSTWVDGVDGEIARIRMMESAWGAKLDIFCDNVIHFLLFLSLGLGLTASTGAGLYTWLGWIAAVGSIASFILLSNSVIDWKARAAAGEGADESRKIEDRLANRDFIWLLLVLAVLGRLDFFIWLSAIGVSVFALYLLILRLRGR